MHPPEIQGYLERERERESITTTCIYSKKFVQNLFIEQEYHNVSHNAKYKSPKHAGPVGELVTPPPLPEHTLTVYVSGVTRRSSGGDCLPSLSLS